MSIEAVLWDFGGVFTTSPFEAFNRYEAERGLPHDFIRSVNARDPDTNAWSLFERSKCTAAEFDSLFAEESERLGHRVPGRDVIALLSGEVRPRMVTALRRCKARFKVGCITNNVASGEGPGMAGTSEKARAIAEIMGLFDHIIESSKAGVRKPDPRIYAMMCEALEVAPQACVYLDDLGINCKPAAEMGMRAIKVTHPDRAIAALEDLVGFPLG
ncbi:MAG: HAD-IA family hydrolase [Alphaproteobacteria bacterium]|nr:HAD-IA family hydrolase [Alphaproteobacteria bacterium]